MNVHENLKHLRERAGFTVAELSKKTGIAKTTLSRWENSDSLPNIENAAMLAEFYGVSLDELKYGVKIEAGNVSEPANSASSDTAKKSQRQGTITLCLAAVIVLLVGALIFVCTDRSKQPESEYDIHSSQDDIDIDQINPDAVFEFDLTLPQE